MECCTEHATVFDITDQIEMINMKFQRACQQFLILDNVIVDTERRYQSATTEGHQSSRYCLRMKIAILEEIRDMFSEYATEKVKEMQKLKNRQIEMWVLAEVDWESDNGDMEVMWFCQKSFVYFQLQRLFLEPPQSSQKSDQTIIQID